MTAQEALHAWDSGETITTIEMGGLGPGYEQAIHITVFETIRELIDDDLSAIPQSELSRHMDNAMFQSQVISNLGISGAQAGAAKQVAYKALTQGWDELVKSIPTGRQIMVSKRWPNGASGEVQ